MPFYTTLTLYNHSFPLINYPYKTKKGCDFLKKAKKLTWNMKCMLCLLPSLVGLMVFFIIPYIRVLYYSFINNQFKKDFVGLQNYITAINNEFFRLAFKNSMLLIFLCVPVLIALALLISLGLTFLIKKWKFIRVAFILPMLLPTASIVLVFRAVFSSIENVLPLYLLFIWKNIGICVILLTAALTTIDGDIYESAKLDGASGFLLHKKITLPLIFPTISFSTLMAIVNSFKIFRESFLYYGDNYPPDYGYTLQYYMNNNFLKFDYQALAASSVLTSFLVAAIVMISFTIERRYQQ